MTSENQESQTTQSKPKVSDVLKKLDPVLTEASEAEGVAQVLALLVLKEGIQLDTIPIVWKAEGKDVSAIDIDHILSVTKPISAFLDLRDELIAVTVRNLVKMVQGRQESEDNTPSLGSENEQEEG